MKTLADNLFLFSKLQGVKKVLNLPCPKKNRTKMLDMNVYSQPSESQLQMSHIGSSRLAQFHLTRKSISSEDVPT